MQAVRTVRNNQEFLGVEKNGGKGERGGYTKSYTQIIINAAFRA